MQLRYFVPFKVSAKDQSAMDAALAEKKLDIAGVAIDSSVNANKWQIPEEDLDFVAAGLPGVQLRTDHSEAVSNIIGKVDGAQRKGQQVLFQAEIGDVPLIEKILRDYVNHVSIQIDSDDVECSKCKKPTRVDGALVHLCPGAWEVIHKPKVRELSIVASPAYKDAAFKPAGFGAAMDENQTAELVKQQALTASHEKLSLKLELLRLQAKARLAD
jgi:hypothetical protein